MLEIIGGSYSEVELSDGRTGNYEVAQQYYRDFDRLAHEQPAKFNQLCAYILPNHEAKLTPEHKSLLADIGLAWRTRVNGEIILKKREEEIKDFLRLSVRQGALSRLFTALSLAEPSYHLVSPFKRPNDGCADKVAYGYRWMIFTDWIGSDYKDYPGNKLVP